MPTLRNKRHELVAQGLAKGLNQTEAYIKAGYSAKSSKSGACMLLKNSPEIETRVEEILTRKAQMAQASTNQAVKNVGISKEYVLRAAMDVLEISLGRKKVNKTRSAMTVQDVPAEDGKVDKVHTVKTADYQAFAPDLAVAGKMTELLGRDVNLFVETKRLQTGPLDSVPQDQVDEALAIINAAIAAGEAKALAESGSADADPRPQDA